MRVSSGRNWIADGSLAIVFLVSVAGIVFGFVGKEPDRVLQMTPGYTISLSVILLILSVFLEYVNLTSQRVKKIHTEIQLMRQYTRQSTVNILKDLPYIYHAAKMLVVPYHDSYPESIKSVTMSFCDEQDSAPRNEFLAAKNKAIEKGVHCLEIVGLTTNTPEYVKNRLLKFSKIKNYGIAILAKDVPYAMRMLVVEKRGAHLRIPKVGAFYEPGHCFEFREDEPVEALDAWFMDLWQRATIIKEPEMNLDEGQIQEIVADLRAKLDSTTSSS